MARIFIIDEESSARHLLQYTLQREGFEVTCTADCDEVPLLLEQMTPDAVILEVNVTGSAGWQLVGNLRKHIRLPLLLVGRGDHHEVMKGFRLGADDYMGKPYHPEELVMRVKALLRRFRSASLSPIQFGDFMINRATHEVSVQGQSLILPLKEFQLLFTLASYANQILTRTQLIEQVWGMNYEGGERTVDVHIKRLRNKLCALGKGFEITTVRGVGYRMDVHDGIPSSKY